MSREHEHVLPRIVTPYELEIVEIRKYCIEHDNSFISVFWSLLIEEGFEIRQRGIV